MNARTGIVNGYGACLATLRSAFDPILSPEYGR
jgi:hypothetical protein